MLRRLFTVLFGAADKEEGRSKKFALELPEWTSLDGKVPDGNWVQWKVHGGQFQVESIIPENEYSDFVTNLVQSTGAWSQVERQDSKLVVKIGLNAEDPGRIIGEAPSEVAVYERKLPVSMPRASKVKGILSDNAVARIVVSGLMPPAKVRRENGWEEAPPKSIELSASDLSSFEKLMTRLKTAELLSAAAAQELTKVRQEQRLEQIMDENPVERVSDGLNHFKLPDAELREYMRKADNDLSEQCAIINNMLDAWFSDGTSPAPYYARRLGIILRKSKRKDLDGIFTAEWNRHFS